jgi:23S rRNA (guanosine2251-2'-O)-methyltransferase
LRLLLEAHTEIDPFDAVLVCLPAGFNKAVLPVERDVLGHGDMRRDGKAVAPFCMGMGFSEGEHLASDAAALVPGQDRDIVDPEIVALAVAHDESPHIRIAKDENTVLGNRHRVVGDHRTGRRMGETRDISGIDLVRDLPDRHEVTWFRRSYHAAPRLHSMPGRANTIGIAFGGLTPVARSSKKPEWVVKKEQASRGETPSDLWLFGLHAVRDAMENPARSKRRLIVTKNAADRLADAIAKAGIEPEIADPRRFTAPIDPQSVHQGAALQVDPLDWGSVSELCAPKNELPLVLLLDRVTDPHNVGAILRSAEVFGARAVIAPHRHSAPETGALAKTASGALERQPYLRVPNLANAMNALREMGFLIIGLDGEADETLDEVLQAFPPAPLALALGAEGPGLRELTRKTCHKLARIPAAGAFGSLNVSNAAAVSLYAASQARKR